MSNSKRMILKLDVAYAIGSDVTSAMSAMVFYNNMHCANVIAALDAKNSLDKLFQEESQDEKEKCEEAPDVEFEKKYAVICNAGLEREYLSFVRKESSHG